MTLKLYTLLDNVSILVVAYNYAEAQQLFEKELKRSIDRFEISEYSVSYQHVIRL